MLTSLRMVGAPAAAALALALPTSTVHGQRDARPQPALAESALARGEFDRVVDLARDYTAHHPDDWRGWFVQGEATLRRGGSASDYRVAAIIAFRRATRLAPERPEVWDGYGRAGLELGSADGELILHEAYEKVLAFDALYPGAFENWRKAYRDRADRERLRRILARHDSVPEVRARIAELLIEDEQYGAAIAVLDSLLVLDPQQPAWLALRGQSALESGDTVAGGRLYARALANADRPGAELLWQQIIGIATPEEIRAWDSGIAADQRSGFLQSFWARRNPDLFAGTNRRIAEHFARLRIARKQFQSTHPIAGYRIRTAQRALLARPTVSEQMFYLTCEAQEYPGAPMRAADRARMPLAMESSLLDPSTRDSWKRGMFPADEWSPDPWQAAMINVPYNRDIRDIDTTAAAIGYNLRTNLDDRGLTFLRFGPPQRRMIGSANAIVSSCHTRDLERWDYDDVGTVRFFRVAGELVFRPMNDELFEAMKVAMTRNATSVAAPLGYGVWTAQFAGPDPETTDIVVVTTRGAAAAQLIGSLGQATAPRLDSSGVVVLRASPGWYALVTNATVGDSLGRLALRLSVHTLGGDWGVSDLLLAPAWSDTQATRGTMLGRLRRDLTFTSGTTLRAYAEVYGLRRPTDGYVGYRASYQIYRTSDLHRDAQREELPGGVRLEFERQRPVTDGRVTEWLDITAAQVPPGRYLLRLEVLAPGGVQVIGRAQIAFEIRER
jgi:GWxTD domain-containing protein